MMAAAFAAAALILGAVVLSRQLDLLSVAAVCLVIYNWHCASGYVYVASHEVQNELLYESALDFRVQAIILLQLLAMTLFILCHDAGSERARKQRVKRAKYSDEQVAQVFKWAGIVSLVFLASNVFSIGLAGLTAAKALVWGKTNVLYVPALWLAMGVFAYALKTRRYGYLWLSLPQILIHLFIGSRAYFAVICIVAIVCIATSQKYSVTRNAAFFAIGFLALMIIMVYKKIYMAVKSGDLGAIVSILQDSDTYNWVFRWGEPRIVLANFNYVVTSGLTLGGDQILGRFVSAVPFLNDLYPISEKDLLLSTVVIQDLDSSYGLASNIWGEFYAMGSYPLVAVMYALWLALIGWGNKQIKNGAWTASFALPLMTYFAFYIHRMDFVKVLGNAKMLVFAMLIWWVIGCLVTKRVSIGEGRPVKASVRMATESAAAHAGR